MDGVGRKLLTGIKTLIVAYLVSAVMLLILAAVMYSLKPGKDIIYAGVLATYIVSNIAGGIIIGKVKRKQKYIWGFIVGLGYFVVLTIISLIVNKSFYSGGAVEAVTALICCSLGGMAGGMIS